MLFVMDTNDTDAMLGLMMSVDSKEKVAELFERLKMLTPEGVWVYYEYGVRLFEFEKYEEAKAAFEKSRELVDDFNPGMTSEWISKCYKAMGKNEAAKLEYERARFEDPNLAIKG